jgi:hypothetical protein
MQRVNWKKWNSGIVEIRKYRIAKPEGIGKPICKELIGKNGIVE